MPVNSFRPRMLNQYPDLNSFMEDAQQKIADAYATGSADKVEAVDKALAGRLRNYQLLSEYENERQAVLNRARQFAEARKEQERQANAERLANFKGLMAGPITNVREVGPAGYQPGFQGGMDFASLQGTSPPPPDNKYAKSLLDGLNQGSQKAKEQNRTSTQGFFSDAREGVSSLLGGLGDALSSPFAQRILAIMARPEFQDPRGIGPGLINAAYGLSKDEAAAAKVRREEQRLENEARRQAFLDKIRLEELGLSRRRTELSEKTEERVAGKPVTVKTPTEKEYKQLESRLEIIPGVEKYISKSSRSWMYGPGENPNVVRRRLIYAANEEAERKGISFEDAVAILTGLGGSPRSTTTAPQSARPGVKERG